MNKEKLHSIFEHNDCLTEDQLLRYTQNQISNLERNAVEQHTIDCKFCSDALEGFEKNGNKVGGYLEAKSAINHTTKAKTTLISIISSIAAILVIAFLATDIFDIAEVQTAENKETTNERLTSEEPSERRKETLKTAKAITSDTVSFKKETNINQQENSIKPKELDAIKVDDELEEDAEEITIEETHFNALVEEEVIFKDNDTKQLSELKLDNNFSQEGAALAIEENEQNNLLDKEADRAPTAIKSKQFEFTQQDSLINTTDLVNDEMDQEVTTLEKTENKTVVISSETKRKVSSVTKSSFKIALKAFDEKQYQRAILQLELIKPEESKYFEAQLYLGKSYLKLENEIKAKHYLTVALQGNKKVKKEAQQILDAIK